jgi:protein-tyrosine phosphatase
LGRTRSRARPCRALIDRLAPALTLDYSQITEQVYIGAWPTKYHRDTVISLGVTLLVATILESIDKELDQPPLEVVHTRGTDLGKYLIFPTSQLLKGVEPAVTGIRNGDRVMVFCKAGKHRSATVTSCVLVGLGHSPDEAMGIVEAGRPIVEFNDAMRQKVRGFESVWQERHPPE